jgi:hypothetical protein
METSCRNLRVVANVISILAKIGFQMHHSIIHVSYRDGGKRSGAKVVFSISYGADSRLASEVSIVDSIHPALAVTVGLVSGVVCSLVGQAINKRKNRPLSETWFACMFLGPLGLFLILLAPKRQASPLKEECDRLPQELAQLKKVQKQ